MNEKQVLESDALKRRFIKDCNLPISLTDNPYFMERLGTLYKTHGALEKFGVYCDSLAEYENEQGYFEEYTRIKEAAMEHIKQSAGYKRFCDSTLHFENHYSTADVYKEYNNEHLFISIDMKQANFNALNYYDSTIFADENGKKSETWRDFLGQFTDNEHILNSKYIREVVLGNCNPKKQIQYEHALMIILANHLVEAFPNINIYSVKNDEILISCAESTGFSKNELEAVIEAEINGIGKLVTTELFELHKIENTSGWMIQYYGDYDDFAFKCLSADVFHQYVKHYYGEPINEDDLVFRYNGKLARFLEPVENH